ncbi:Acetyltransferase (GNAT) domain-containing protein [Butyrivibrio sp. INlla14]|nr:GNAT family N-acetyltransferase [Butyrivibrio sp. INlla14]SCY71744.1 Acetyltransferase (GNAT) domain-containing protein [Butyrivibrio sp. INlla14]
MNEKLQIVEYYSSDDWAHWLSEINKSDWRAGEYLHELIRKNELKKLCGERTKVLLLTDKDRLLSFCTYAEQDDVRDPSLTPWAGFVYTFPEFRGKHFVGRLLEYASGLARKDGHEYLYISTGETGLYEKYGFTFWKQMKDVNGEESRIYRKRTDVAIRMLHEDEKDLLKDFLYEAIYIPEGVEPPPKDIIFQPELRLYYENFGTDPADNCIVAEDQGRVIGAVWTRIMNDYGHVDDETPSFAISLYKEYRGKGIGTKLMKEMLALLKEQGYGTASLAVQKANYAVKMYKNVGFKTVDENAEEYIMVCEL